MDRGLQSEIVRHKSMHATNSVYDKFIACARHMSGTGERELFQLKKKKKPSRGVIHGTFFPILACEAIIIIAHAKSIC